jgi:hypothetical protein
MVNALVNSVIFFPFFPVVFVVARLSKDNYAVFAPRICRSESVQYDTYSLIFFHGQILDGGGLSRRAYLRLFMDLSLARSQKLISFLVRHCRLCSYYTKWTRGIITTVINKLADDPSRRFIWEEISFFERWWQEQDQLMQHKVRKYEIKWDKHYFSLFFGG